MTRYRREETAGNAVLEHMGEPYLFVAGVHSVMSQLVQIRANYMKGSGSDVHVATDTYRCDSIEAMDRLLSDIRARRIDAIDVSERQWGARRLVINYFGA